MKTQTSYRSSSSLFCFFFFACFTLLSCTSKKATLFSSLPSSATGIEFVNQPQSHKLFNILYYLYYYNGGGVATGDINGDGLPDIYFSANRKGGNKLYLNKGNFTFEDITEKAGVAGSSDWNTGVTMADVNGDGKLDIYVCSVNKAYGLQGHNELFINNGNLTFTESAAKYGLDFSGFSTQAAFFDYDHDGDLDMYLLNQSNRPHANIKDTSNRRRPDPLAGDRFYRNESNNHIEKFTDVSAQAGIYQSNLGYGLGLAVADMNNDGWDDLYIGNDFHENDYYYINNGNGSFTESGAQHFNHYSRFSMGNDIADYNNDGQPDLVTVDMLPPQEKILKTYGSDENIDIYKVKLTLNGYQEQYSRNCLQRNNGSGASFSETALLSNVAATDWSWSPLFADFDNDGNKDLFISSGIVKRPVDLDYVRFISDLSMHKGMDQTDAYDQEAIDKMPDGSSHPFLFKGTGDFPFKEVSEEWGTADMKGYFNGAAYVDLDNDGNLDMVISSINAPAVILKNNSPKKSFLSLSFQGSGPNSNGIGAKAYLFQHGKIQYQQLMATRGFQSSSDTRMHFGLNNEGIDSLLVVWPDQKFQLLKKMEANKFLKLSQSEAAGKFDYAAWFPQKHDWLLPSKTGLPDWTHRENDFVDFNVQYLIPHAESTRGPKLAVADVNGDGRDDIYACGAKGQPGTLLIQTGNGRFSAAEEKVFSGDAGCEDVDAVFFDANGDGKPDLYVVSGGNEATGNDPVLLDRLYLNDGHGHFTKSMTLPPVFANKSCVTAADVDHDGDLDLFVGTLADAHAYGIPQTSYLLLNDGRGNFSVAPSAMIPLKNLGIVTAAAFADLNKDGWKDLVVVGEWMPVTVFINKHGSFERQDLPNSTGWWQTVLIDDVNNDGNQDLLLGNWGWNNKFSCGRNAPVRLYVSDFDKNGKVDQLLSYTKENKEYPFLAKDEVERSLPVLRKHYLRYDEFAGLEMKDAYYGFAEQVKPLLAERMGSALCLGNGKGDFSITDLPAALQLSPCFAFQKLGTIQGENMYLGGGNFYDVIPYEGRYDAQPLALFTISKTGQIQPVMQSSLYNVKEQVRDLRWIKMSGQDSVLAVAANNSPLLFYKLFK